MDLQAAITAHVAWRMHLRTAIARKEKVDAAAIRSASRCDLGRWLAGEGRTKHGGAPEFGGLVARHEEFHREAAAVADAVNAGEYARAETMLGRDSAYARASMEVSKAVLALQQRVG